MVRRVSVETLVDKWQCITMHQQKHDCLKEKNDESEVVEATVAFLRLVHVFDVENALSPRDDPIRENAVFTP